MIDLKNLNIILPGATGAIGGSILTQLYKSNANIIACGTNSGLGPMTSGQTVTVNVSSIGKVTNKLI